MQTNKILVGALVVALVVIAYLFGKVQSGGGGGPGGGGNQAATSAPLPDLTVDQARSLNAGITQATQVYDLKVEPGEKTMTVEGNFVPGEGLDKVSLSDCRGYLNYANPAGGAALRTEAVKAKLKDNSKSVYFKVEDLEKRTATLKIECKAGSAMALVAAADVVVR